MRTLDQLAADPRLRVAGWDSYDAAPLQNGPIEAARLFLSRINVVPTAEGGIQFEWHTHGVDLEVEFHDDGTTTVFLSDPKTQRCLCIPDDDEPEQARGEAHVLRVGGGQSEPSKP